MNKDGSYKLQKKDWSKWILKTSNREELTKKFQKLNTFIDVYLSSETSYDSHLELGQLRAKVDEHLESVTNQLGLQSDLM
ncbi:hypothetical protein EIP86_007512 [Pleurotus ostreatoroseus]|nr:hypothetical protein EIP86_007512 [Pleurotus ostreatoroseus]